MSEKESKANITVACRLPARELAVRRRVVADEIFRGALRADELEDGYVFTFVGDEEKTAELAQFIAAERRCCPFLTFELLFEPEGAQAMIRSMMGPAGDV